MPGLDTRNGGSYHLILYYFYIFMMRLLYRGFFPRHQFHFGRYCGQSAIHLLKINGVSFFINAHLPLTYISTLLRLSFSCVNLIAVFIMVELPL
jgi:hypothetical protein